MMMKRQKIYCAGLAAALLCGCTAVGEPSGRTGGEGSLRFSIRVPGVADLSTRSLGETVQISGLSLLIFDSNGFLLQYVRADRTEEQTAPGETAFRAEVNSSDERRIIHLIANYEVGALPFGSESELIRNMTVSDGAEAYWQRVELPDGIPNDGTTPDGLRSVPIVRNFAKISLTSEAADFVLEDFAVVNVPDCGSVAPLSSGNTFADYSEDSDYQTLTESHYQGFLPEEAQLTASDVSALSYGKEPFYLYEHPYSADASYTYLLVRGRYRGGDLSFYKIDLGYSDAETGVFTYYNILRNFSYRVTISTVSKQGWPTAAEAAKNPAGNNLSASLDLQNLLNISDGNHILYVSYIDTILMDARDVSLKYRYVPDVRSAAADNGAIALRIGEDGDRFIRSAAIAPQDEADGWRRVTLSLDHAPGLTVERQSLMLYNEDSRLQRTVRYTLRSRFSLQAACTQNVPRTLQAPVDVTLTLPEGIPQSLFPLSFYFETAANSLYPDPSRNQMDIQTGESIIPDKAGLRSFGFVRKLSWTEYEASTEVVCAFLTNMTDSATTLYIQSPLFDGCAVSFSNSWL